MLIFEDVIMPPILFYVKSKEEAVAYIGAILVNDTTRRAFWYSV